MTKARVYKVGEAKVTIFGSDPSWIWRVDIKPGVLATLKQLVNSNDRASMIFYRTGHAASFDDAKAKADRAAILAQEPRP